MRLGVVEWLSQRGNKKAYLKCYSDCNKLISAITEYAYLHNLQRKLFGNWSPSYRKICDRANKIFEADETNYYAPCLNFIGEYDSEDVSEVYKVEVLQKEKDSTTCAFYIASSKESDATVVSFYHGAIVPSVARGKNGKEKQIDEGELSTIRALIKSLDPLLEQTDDTMFYYLRNVGEPFWYHKK